MKLDADLKKNVRSQLCPRDLTAIEAISRCCFETGLAPIIHHGCSEQCNANISEMEKKFETLVSESWPSHFAYSKQRLMLIELLHDKMREIHINQFLDFGVYLAAVQSRCPQLASIVSCQGDDAGLMRLQDALRISSKEGIRLEVDQAIPGSTNSCHELQDVLGRFRKRHGVYVRLNAFRLLDVNSSFDLMEKAAYFGRPMNKKWLNALVGEESAEHGPGENSMSPSDCRVQYLFTRLDSKNGKEEIEFSCEELPNGTGEDTQCTRFIHGIYRPDLEKFEHFDGAIHFYEPHEYADRCGKHLKQRHKGYRKAKIFRIDELLDFDDVGFLIATFFRWNSVAPEYFAPLISQPNLR